MLRAVVMACTLALSAPAFAMAVTDDPFKPFAKAEIETPIAANAGWNFCHTGGSISLWVSAPRDGSGPLLGVTVILRTLRSPGSAYVELLGGLGLTELNRDSANFDCSNGCHNDFLVSYTLPAATISAIAGKGSIPLRISIRGEPKCAVEAAISATDLAELQAWAASRR